MRPGIVFLHIPKTGGTTLNGVLRWHYPPSAYYGNAVRAYDPGGEASLSPLKCMPPRRRRRIRLVFGHYDMTRALEAYRCLETPRKYILTLLRDPVERVVSEYYFLLSSSPHRARLRGLGLKGYVLSGLARPNLQTHMIAGTSPYLDSHRRWTLRAAKENLRQGFVRFGLTERFDETLLLWRKPLALTRLGYRRELVTARRPAQEELPKPLLGLVRSRNAMDMELYGYASELFAKELRRQPRSFQRLLRRLRLANALLALPNRA